MAIQASEFALTPPAASSFPADQGDERDGDGAGGTVPTTSEPFGVSQDMTPNGIEVYYQSGPKRLYRVRDGKYARDESLGEDHPLSQWREVPSVTTVLGVIDKSGPLKWWGQGVGGIGTMKLDHQGVDLAPVWELVENESDDDARELLGSLLTEHKLSVNHVSDRAADRGVNVHMAFEQWATDQRIKPQSAVFEPTEQGYVDGLAQFLDAIEQGDPTDIQAEVTVGSLEHWFAGRYDLRMTVQTPVSVVTRTYPKRKDKVEEIPAGRYLLDLKTSKGVYPTHFLQLEAYEAASVECGYEPTDYRGVVHVTKEGKYELRVNGLVHTKNPWSFDDFALVRQLYGVMSEVKR